MWKSKTRTFNINPNYTISPCGTFPGGGGGGGGGTQTHHHYVEVPPVWPPFSRPKPTLFEYLIKTDPFYDKPQQRAARQTAPHSSGTLASKLTYILSKFILMKLINFSEIYLPLLR